MAEQTEQTDHGHEDADDDKRELDFTTLGMFIIDQIHFGPASARKVVDDIIGGAGTYAILGARLFSPPPQSRRIGWIVDAGRDFPPSLLAPLTALDTHLILRRSTSRLTTRGWNSYPSASSDTRAFHYLTPKLRLEAIDLISSGLVRARCVHLICSAARAAGLRRELIGGGAAGQIAVWEPVPDLCTPAQRAEMLRTVSTMDVVSPNGEELGAFWEDELLSQLPGGEWERMEVLAMRVMQAGAGAVVVRAGKLGCLVVGTEGAVRLPAYYEGGERNHSMVVDPTGGGNAFVGGLGMGLARGVGMVEAAAMGTVAASFAIEQIGMPVLTRGVDGDELWNGVSVSRRLEEYRQRLEAAGMGWRKRANSQ
ncbi:Ribokinase-like protein [Tricharina praecox]|uniref:Ribokinase-like protein n=1 Tax=Tricharina praecox TaxID=43433 RepID=UPI0022210753|nr:Ribokinase-like protein [Tricharina praecox]KAI5850880.1 Ribokinase-like protein [Tricharina praecox]